MGETTAIEWTDKTHNEWIGCTKVSVGEQGACVLCYAEDFNERRFHGGNWGPGAPRRLTSDANRRQPLRWNREAERTGVHPWVFCSSLADVFDNEVPPSWRRSLWGTIASTPALRWQLLTKRIGNAARMLPDPAGIRAKWQHVGIMATIANQAEADRDIPKLLELKATHGVKWVGLSCEPLLGPIDLSARWDQPDWTIARELDWIVAGGETDPARKGRARPSHPDWFRGLRDACECAGVPFLFKQWGDWRHMPERAHFKECAAEPWRRVESMRDQVRPALMFQIGKKAAGRILDGRTHDERPRVYD